MSPQEPAAARARHRFVVGFNEGDVLGDGWHARTRDGRCGVWMRPAEPVAHVVFRVPRAWRERPVPVRVEALVCGAPTLLGSPVDVAIEAARGGEREPLWARLASWRLHQDVWVARHVLVPSEAIVEPAAGAATAARAEPRPTIRLRLTTSPILVPDAVFDNEDYRRMGVQLASLTFTRMEEEAGARDADDEEAVASLDPAPLVPSLP